MAPSRAALERAGYEFRGANGLPGRDYFVRGARPGGGDVTIYCPRCEYEPRASDRWMCAPGCGTIWNTFETRARCPGCQKHWRDTCCPACCRWSPHEDWYHEEVLDAAEAGAESERELVGVP